MNIFSFSPFGYEGSLVSVEVDLRRGIPSVDLVGLADSAVKESRERIRAAIRNSGFEFPPDRVLISLSPADLKKEGAGFDLPLALAVLLAKHLDTVQKDGDSVPVFPPGNTVAGGTETEEKVSSCLVMGELDLSGFVRPVRGIHAALATAAENGIKYCIIPESCRHEAYGAPIGVCAVETLKEAFEKLCGGIQKFCTPPFIDGETKEDDVQFAPVSGDLDFSTVKNQGRLVRALQIAAAGGHNLITYGPPGCGKTLAVRRLPSILPLLTRAESRPVSRIYSIAGLIPAGSRPLTTKPFRSPHQSASIEGMTGGGTQCLPGEISLAHNGVLFLDEAAEFKTNVLQSLRIPLETGKITLSRAGRQSVYPAQFQLIIASNPCPCGNFGSADKVCVCSPNSVERYWKKFSAPLLDRIDLRVPLLEAETGEAYRFYDNISSGQLRPPIALAVHIQRQRQHKLNAFLTPEECKRHIHLGEACSNFLNSVIESENLSGRGENSILKLSRTIADMAGSEEILIEHLIEAVDFRKNEGGLDICF